MGDPEPWEAPCLFTSAKLEALIEELEADSVDEAETARETAALRSLWSNARVVENQTRPPADGRLIERAIARHFGLPVRK